MATPPGVEFRAASKKGFNMQSGDNANSSFAQADDSRPGVEFDLLGGAERKRLRPRGFVDWRPRAATQEILEQAQAILIEYHDLLPLTVRQIFYRLVGKYKYEKTERAYKRLGEYLVMARRARIIPMGSIRDDGGVSTSPSRYRSADQYFGVLQDHAPHFQIDRSAALLRNVLLYCEAAGMVPQLERVADPNGVQVISGGGFDSLTEKYKLACIVAVADRPTEVLHIGDHDPSGAHLFLAFAEDVRAFAAEFGSSVSFTRLAVTPEQIEQYELPTAPRKEGDKRAFTGETCQAEALAPDDLARIVRDAIEARVDAVEYDKLLRREKRERKHLIARLGRGPSGEN